MGNTGSAKKDSDDLSLLGRYVVHDFCTMFEAFVRASYLGNCRLGLVFEHHGSQKKYCYSCGNGPDSARWQVTTVASAMPPVDWPKVRADHIPEDIVALVPPSWPSALFSCTVRLVVLQRPPRASNGLLTDARGTACLLWLRGALQQDCPAGALTNENAAGWLTTQRAWASALAFVSAPVPQPLSPLATGMLALLEATAKVQRTHPDVDLALTIGPHQWDGERWTRPSALRIRRDLRGCPYDVVKLLSYPTNAEVGPDPLLSIAELAQVPGIYSWNDSALSERTLGLTVNAAYTAKLSDLFERVGGGAATQGDSVMQSQHCKKLASMLTAFLRASTATPTAEDHRDTNSDHEEKTSRRASYGGRRGRDEYML